MNGLETIAARLTWARKRHGWTQSELAGRAGTTKSNVVKLESGAPHQPHFDAIIERLAKELHVRAEWLTTGEEPLCWLAQMTGDEQVRQQTGPGTEGLPGFCVIDGGVWEETPDGWQVNRRELMRR